MKDIIKVRVEVSLPWHNEPIVIWRDVHVNIASGALFPLPRDRELSFMFYSQQRAAQQIKERPRVAELIGKEIAAAVMKAVESRDSINGYTPEEWKRMHTGGST